MKTRWTKSKDSPKEIISPYCVNVVISRILFPKCREEFFDWKLNLNLYPQWDEIFSQETFLFVQFTRKQLYFHIKVYDHCLINSYVLNTYP